MRKMFARKVDFQFAAKRTALRSVEANRLAHSNIYLLNQRDCSDFERQIFTVKTLGDSFGEFRFAANPT